MVPTAHLLGSEAIPWLIGLGLVVLGAATLEGLVRTFVLRLPYDWRAYAASLGDGVGRRAVDALGLSIAAPLLALVYAHRFASIPLSTPAAFAVLFIGQEVLYYVYHRAAHRVRWFWATHSVHHSSNELTLAAALRLGWTGKLTGTALFFMPLVWLGFSPLAVGAVFAANLLYQFWLHAPWIPRLGPLEWVLNTPTHHKVHHASNTEYLDCNYGGVLIVFDRLFGTFRDLRDDVPLRYGLTTPLTSHNPLRIATHGWVGLARDLRKATGPVDAFAIVFGAPDRPMAARSSRRWLFATAAIASVALLGACGGGGGGGDSDSGGAGSGGTGTSPPVVPTNAERTTAATATALSSSNACAPIEPFYWEVGDQTAALASGSVASTSDPTVYTSSTLMSIASASKWIYASYFVQRQNGALTDADVKFLNFTSGYTSFSSCTTTQTVQECVDSDSNDVYSAAADGRFSYGGGHMEKHASINGLGAMSNGPLATEIMAQIGAGATIAYSQPQLAGGIFTTADDYARFLRAILAGTLKMHDALGTHAVCTNPLTCPSALETPIPTTVSWHYAVGHWVEDDPVTGDGAFSSAGSFGFYPWIDAGKTTYGIVARSSGSGSGFDSASCGALIRKAWATATAQ